MSEQRPSTDELIATPGFGLDLASPDAVTDAEKDAFRVRFEQLIGRRHIGLEYLLEERPDTLKRYRNWADRITADGFYNPNGFGFLTFYALSGFVEGVRYLVHVEQRMGLSKAQILDGISVAFLWIGPRGIETVALALRDFEWQQPEPEGPRFPANWDLDPAALASGLDFSTEELSASELGALEAWYLRYAGEVPRQITALARLRPDLLKAHRQRYEAVLTVLPKQVLPWVTIHVNVQRGFVPGIREGVLLARGFGMTRTQTVQAISWGLFYGGTEAAALVDEAAGEILERWEEHGPA